MSVSIPKSASDLADNLGIKCQYDSSVGQSRLMNSHGDGNYDMNSSSYYSLQELLIPFNITENDYDTFRNITGIVLRYNPRGNAAAAFCYCEAFREFSVRYKNIHGYLSLVVCVFGVISNLLNIVVLSRREMSILSINRILTWLAATDILLMLEYIPFILIYYVRLSPNWLHSYKGAMFIFFHVNFTQILHTISIFMTLALAFWRYTAIKYPQRNAAVSNQRKCNRCVMLAYVLPFAFCLPSYFIFDINEYSVRDEDGQLISIYVVHLSKYAEQDDELYFLIYLWMYAVVIKLVPCVILTLITCWLINTLKSASERRNVLINRSYSPTTITVTINDSSNCDDSLLVVTSHHNGTVNSCNTNKNLKRQSRIDRTTSILIAVLVLFIITELPQGVLGLLSGIYGKKFFTTCYVLLGDLMDLLALFNGAVNFILYCWMSKQFRKTFGQLFKPRLLLSNLMQPPTQEIEMITTNV